eukprot:11220604-Lingulodinium_polyedra.AAC.1
MFDNFKLVWLKQGTSTALKTMPRATWADNLFGVNMSLCACDCPPKTSPICGACRVRPGSSVAT